MSLLHVHPPSFFALALSARFPPVCQCMCVSYYIYIYMHIHTPKKIRTPTKKSGKKRDREEVLGRNRQWLVERATCYMCYIYYMCNTCYMCMLHLQVLEACLGRSLHACLHTSNNCMFQAQRSRGNQPNARMRAHVRMDTFLPRLTRLCF